MILDGSYSNPFLTLPPTFPSPTPPGLFIGAFQRRTRPSSKPARLPNGADALFGLDRTQSTCVNLAGLSSDAPFHYKVLMVAPDRHFCIVVKATDH